MSDLQNIQLKIYIQPNAKKLELCGWHQDFFKIKIPAPAIDNQANVTLQKWLAKYFDVPLKQITILNGVKSRYKTLMIQQVKDAPSWPATQKK